MKVKKSLILGISLLMMVTHPNVKAYTEGPLIKNEDYYSKSIVANISEEDKVIELSNHDILIGSNSYSVQTIEKNQNEDNKKVVSKQKKEKLKTDNQEYIKKHFGYMYSYSDEEYEGSIPITNMHINRIDTGQYQELREKRIEFTNFSKNDLNDIKKEINENGTTYYLIKVDWQIEKTETIDNQQVPISYKGTMIYQTVITLNYPYEYEITITYSGEVSKKDKQYTYTALYMKKEVVEEQKNDNIIPIIIISGIGLGIATLIFLLSNKNIIIYNKSNSGYKLLGKYKLHEDKNKVIDITRYSHKISSNIYCLKLKNSLYKKIKGKIIYVRIKNISKPITITSRYIEVII